MAYVENLLQMLNICSREHLAPFFCSSLPPNEHAQYLSTEMGEQEGCAVDIRHPGSGDTNEKYIAGKRVYCLQICLTGGKKKSQASQL